MAQNRGFTLTETLIAAAILVCGLVAVASVFSFAVQANLNNRRLILATTLLYDKMEQFKSVPLTDPIWNGDGSDEAGQDRAYRRVWRVTMTIPRSVTVIVYGPGSPPAPRETELIRATTLASPTF